MLENYVDNIDIIDDKYIQNMDVLYGTKRNRLIFL